MRLCFDLPFDGVRVRETLEGPSEDDILRQLRYLARARLPWYRYKVALLWDDCAFWRLIVESHNHRHEASEPIPMTAPHFLSFAERAGYASRA